MSFVGKSFRGLTELYDDPEWYHLLKNNCGLNIVRYANAAGREGSFDMRHLLNGWLDRYLHEAGFLDSSLPFAELRQRSHINEAAVATPNTIRALRLPIHCQLSFSSQRPVLEASERAKRGRNTRNPAEAARPIPRKILRMISPVILRVCTKIGYSSMEKKSA